MLFLEYPLLTSSISDCVKDIAETINKTDAPSWFVCMNPHSYAIAKKDPQFKSALANSDWLVPDGSGVVLSTWFLGKPVHERITGSDIFYGLHDLLNRQDGGASVFFLGSSEETLADIRQRMKVDYPNLRVVGTYSPAYKPEFSRQEIDTMIAAVNAVQPDVLWVGMTAPKQEKWIYENNDRLNVKFIGAIGAVFDFYTGRVKRSHPVFQKLGLEWLPRLLQEPRRLWRRMFVSAPIFLWDVLKARFKKG